MGSKDITVDEILAEMLESLGDEEEPKSEDGWFVYKDMLHAAKGLKEYQIRDRANKKVEAGEWEKRVWNKQAYYRVKP